MTVTVTPASADSATSECLAATDALALTVYFSAQAVGGASPIAYDWDFGDGSAHSPLPGPSHAYATEGSYTVTLDGHEGAAGS